MKKINLKENFDKGMSVKEIIDKFFSQVFICCEKDYRHKMKEESKEEFEQRLLQGRCAGIEVKCKSRLPIGETILVYAVCTQEEINKLISFDSDYVTYCKDIKVVDGLTYHQPMKFTTYEIQYNDHDYEEFWEPDIHFIIIKKCLGAEQFKRILIAEDDLADAKFSLDSIGITF